MNKSLVKDNAKSSFIVKDVLAHRSIYAAALALVLCTWTRTRQSAFSNAEHDTRGQEPGREGSQVGGGRGGGGLGVRFWGRTVHVNSILFFFSLHTYSMDGGQC